MTLVFMAPVGRQCLDSVWKLFWCGAVTGSAFCPEQLLDSGKLCAVVICENSILGFQFFVIVTIIPLYQIGICLCFKCCKFTFLSYELYTVLLERSILLRSN